MKKTISILVLATVVLGTSFAGVQTASATTSEVKVQSTTESLEVMLLVN